MIRRIFALCIAALLLAPCGTATTAAPPLQSPGSLSGTYSGSMYFVQLAQGYSIQGELTESDGGAFSGSFRADVPSNPAIIPFLILDIVGNRGSGGALSGTARIRAERTMPAEDNWQAQFSGTWDGTTLSAHFSAPAFDSVNPGFGYNALDMDVTVSNSLGDCDVDPSVSVFADFGGSRSTKMFPVKVSSADCQWSASLESPASWVTFTPSAGTGDGVISVTVMSLPIVGDDFDACGTRTAYLNVRTRRGAQTITIYQVASPSMACPCPTTRAAKLSAGGSESLHYARRFRDEVLVRTPRGAEYTRLYYAHADEVTAILETSPWLLVRAARLLDRHTPTLSSIVEGGRAALSDADLAEVDALVADVAASGSPALRRAAARVRLDLGTDAVRTEFGVDVRPGALSKRARTEDPLFAAFAGLGSLSAPEILAAAARGRLYARASQEHASEVLALLAADPRLALRAPGALAHLTSALESVVRTGTATIDAADRDDLDTFLGGLEPSAGPELQSAIVSLRRDLRAPRALEAFGIRTPDAAISRRGTGLAAVDYATYLGSSQDDRCTQVVVDTVGNIYLTGSTSASDFPVSGGVQTTYGGGDSDAFVVKLDPTGSTVLFATFLGGSGQDIGTGLAVDAAGTVYVSGTTTSANFPVAAPLQSSLRGERDGFLVKLDASGSARTLSTYLGGSGSDSATGVAVSGKNVYVAGITASADFPAVKGLRRSLKGSTDAFVMKLKKGGAKIAYSSLFGGSGLEMSGGIAVDAAGNAYVTGVTSSADLPTTRPVQSQFGGLLDGFVVKLNPKGSAVVYATYLGGAEIDGCVGIALDATGNAYVTGTTASTNFPVASALQASPGGGLLDGFVAKLSADGASLAYSTYLGGSDEDRVYRIAVDAAGRAFVTGLTASANFPTRSPVQAQLNGDFYDAFVAVLESTGSSLVSSTFLGGAAEDSGVCVALGPAGAAYVAGETVSTDFPVVGPLQGTKRGKVDVFVVRLKQD